MTPDELTKKFLAYWSATVKTGENSPLDAVERATLDIFIYWLCEYFTVTPIRESDYDWERRAFSVTDYVGEAPDVSRREGG